MIVGVGSGFMTYLRPLSAVLAVGLLLVVGAMSRAAEAPVSAAQQHMSELGPGDSVSIRVFGQPDITDVYVGDDGTISVPLVGSIRVAGLSPVEAAARVTKALKDGGFFVDPHVTILVTQQHSQLVSVIGEVQSSGRYPINPGTTIIDILAQAGGLKETASDVGYVLRNDDSGHVSRFPINLRGITESENTEPNLTLMGGDSIVVPRAERYYVSGAVTSPGAYPMQPGMTVVQAIAQAGGINERGSERRIQVKRRGKNGQYQDLNVKLGDPIQADDIIHVRESIF
jgi:polysaccharide export outer membrane protein